MVSNDGVRLTAEACRAGRALLGWSARDLTREAKVSPNTLSKIENGEPVGEDVAQRVREAFARCGVQLLNGDAPGARLTSPGG